MSVIWIDNKLKATSKGLLYELMQAHTENRGNIPRSAYHAHHLRSQEDDKNAHGLASFIPAKTARK